MLSAKMVCKVAVPYYIEAKDVVFCHPYMEALQ